MIFQSGFHQVVFNNLYENVETVENKDDRLNQLEKFKKIKMIAMISLIVVLAISLFAAIFGGTFGLIAGLVISVPSVILLHDCVKAGNKIEGLIQNHWARYKKGLTTRANKKEIRKEILKSTLILKYIF